MSTCEDIFTALCLTLIHWMCERSSSAGHTVHWATVTNVVLCCCLLFLCSNASEISL
jgi:hypothetical protein